MDTSLKEGVLSGLCPDDYGETELCRLTHSLAEMSTAKKTPSPVSCDFADDSGSTRTHCKLVSDSVRLVRLSVEFIKRCIQTFGVFLSIRNILVEDSATGILNK